MRGIVIIVATITLFFICSCNDRERLESPSFNSHHFFSFDSWTLDYLGEEWVMKHLSLKEDFDGRPVATIIKRSKSSNNEKAVLYIHGYSDYFYQTSLADTMESRGFRFYALDLRRYGRSKLPGQVWYDLRDISDYFEEIDLAIDIIENENPDAEITLMAHSTGGLTASLYAESRGDSLRVSRIILNSPFFDFNVGGVAESIGIPVISFLGGLFPRMVVNRDVSPINCMSLHIDYFGEWQFDTIMKPIQSPMVTAGWIRAVHRAQRELQKGMCIKVPTLVMCSSASTKSHEFQEIHRKSDTVLDVAEILEFASNISGEVQIAIIEDGLHDLVLSGKSAREASYREIFRFLF